MEFKLSSVSSKPDIFTCIFQNLRSFTENLSIIFKPEGMYFQTMDSSRISIIELNLPNIWFDSYIFTGKTDIVLGVSSNILSRILSAREKNQQIHFIYDKDDILDIHFSSEDKTIFDKRFQCPLLDYESDVMTIPEVDYSAEFSLQSSIFSTLINQLKTFGDNLEVQCSEEQIQMKANSTETGSMSVDIDINDLISFSIMEGENLQMSFSLKSLHQISLFKQVTNEIVIRLCPEYPLSIIFPINEEDTYLKIYLAPKIDID
jgi:proliferating cell nuclear antigen PCNA